MKCTGSSYQIRLNANVSASTLNKYLKLWNFFLNTQLKDSDWLNIWKSLYVMSYELVLWLRPVKFPICLPAFRTVGVNTTRDHIMLPRVLIRFTKVVTSIKAAIFGILNLLKKSCGTKLSKIHYRGLKLLRIVD